MNLYKQSFLMEKDSRAVAKHIVSGIRWLIRSVQRDSERAAKQYGLTGAQANALHALSQQGAMNSAQLSRALFVTPANITGIVDRLETKGLVVRQRKPGDRRSVVLSLTDQGKTTAAQMPDPVEARLIEGLSRLSEEEIGYVEQAMDLIFNIVEARPDFNDQGISQP